MDALLEDCNVTADENQTIEITQADAWTIIS
jgi:hypothetical protein